MTAEQNNRVNKAVNAFFKTFLIIFCHFANFLFRSQSREFLFDFRPIVGTKKGRLRGGLSFQKALA